MVNAKSVFIRFSFSRPSPFHFRQGKSFYLELKNAKSTLVKKVEEEIRNLGGMVDDSFSKDTSYVVSNNEEARQWKKNHGSKTGRWGGEVTKIIIF